MTPTPDVSVLIVSYNTSALLRDCLRSVYEETTGIDFEVIVVDNASSDDSAEMIRREFPDVRLIASTENLGFGRANNLAAEHARGRHLLLLNPDTLVHGPAIASLAGFADRHPGHGLYGGRTLRPDGSVDPSSCWGQPSIWSLFCFASGLSTAFKRNRLLDPESLGRWDRDSVRRVGVVTGCLCLAPRNVWDELGGFDPRYFMYGEDTDLSLRARMLGYRPIITPEATITHIVGAASARRADKKVLVFKGVTTLLRLRWSPIRRAIGLALLTTGVWLRSFGNRAGMKNADATKDGRFWPEVWAARDRWLPGYPPFGTDAPSITAAPGEASEAREAEPHTMRPKGTRA